MEKKEFGLTEAFNKGITLGVYIITAKAGNKINGMTAAWVCKVSHEPRMVMVSIGPGKYTHELIQKAGHFAVNTLAEGQQEIGRHFGFVSGGDVDKFKDVEYFEGRTGAPILKNVYSYLECELTDTFVTGSHTLFIGKVIEGQILNVEKAPLVFQRSDFF